MGLEGRDIEITYLCVSHGRNKTKASSEIAGGEKARSVRNDCFHRYMHVLAMDQQSSRANDCRELILRC